MSPGPTNRAYFFRIRMLFCIVLMYWGLVSMIWPAASASEGLAQA